MVNSLLSKSIAIRIDENRIVFGSSYNLKDYLIKHELLKKDIHTLFVGFFDNNYYKNVNMIQNLCGFIDQAISTKQNIHRKIIELNHNDNSNNHCDFNFEIDVFLEPQLTLTISILHFQLVNNSITNYDRYFSSLSDEFTVIKNQGKIGKFVIDLVKNHNIVIGNKNIPILLDIDKHPNDEYFLSRTDQTDIANRIMKSENFFIQSDLLVNGEISFLEDVWKNKERILKVEAKILERSKNGAPLVLGGVLYDISDFVKYKDLEYMQSVYEFAITSGSIGIFYYNHEKYPERYFEANDIYANMLGIEANSEELYHVDDFEKALLPLEEDISSNKDIKKSLVKLLSGSIDGTKDDILKIINHKTKEIKYLLSSSKINSRFKSGAPKRFGGIIIDITERILIQKNQSEFAYKDELTSLPNNRKLLKDMKKRDKGIGLFFDLDHFKQINDQHGHITGNRILKIFADTLVELKVKYPETHPYRLYGDEFFVYSEVTNDSFGNKYNTDLKALLPKNVMKSFPQIIVEASVGITVYDKTKSIDEFIKSADYEMYKEKISKNESSK